MGPSWGFLVPNLCLIRRETLEVEVVVLASERAAKYSRHLVLRPFWAAPARAPAPLSGSTGGAAVLARRVDDALGAAGAVARGDGSPGRFIDLGV